MNTRTSPAVRLNDLDTICVSFMVFLCALVFLFPSRIPAAPSVALRLVGVALLYIGFTLMTARVHPEEPRVILRIVGITALFCFLFDHMQYFQQLLFDSWLDASLLSFEYSLFGFDATVKLQTIVHPILTEGMMFAYVVYLLLLPSMAYVVYRSAGVMALEDYLFHLCLIFLVCYVGYILIPIASPLHFAPELYHVPLEGGLFTWCGEWLRQNQHYPGGSLPSAHCAAATGMLVMAFRYNRKAFCLVLPTVLLLYIATVYGRYHYLSDAILGILVSFTLIWCSPVLVRLMNALVDDAHRIERSVLKKRASSATVRQKGPIGLSFFGKEG